MFSKSAMKAQQLHEMFARKREMEHQQMERTQAVQKYYDHWGKVNQRFENWSTPEYYKQVEEKLQHTKEAKEKAKTLETRRENLRKLLTEEKENYNLEIIEKKRTRSSRAHSTSMLEKINKRLKEEKDIKRKLELEAKLYGKWRHGVDDDKLLFDSKSDNEALAKLNWLDKQMQEQMEKEKEEEMAKERELRMQEELNKAEQLHKERQQIREQEIREIRTLQETHMEKLRERQEESAQLKQEERRHREYLENLDKEMELLEESYGGLQQPAEFGGAYNLTKIKHFMRKRSEVYCNHIKLCISIADRCLPEAEKPDYLKVLKDKFIRQLDSEIYQLSLIDGMYESEAKYNLLKCEELWKIQSHDCYNDLRNILNSEHILKRKLLNDILTKQNELIDIRSTHLNAIESTSEKLKQLIKEEEDSPRPSNNSQTNANKTNYTYDSFNHLKYPGRQEGGGENKKTVTFSPTPPGSNTSSPRGSQGSIQSLKPIPETNSSIHNNPPPRGNQGSIQSLKSIPQTNSSFHNNPPPTRESHRSPGLYNHTNDPSTDSKHLTKSFSNLNLNNWDNETLSKRLSQTAMYSARSLPESNSSYLNKPPAVRESHRSKGLYNHNYDPSPDPIHMTKSFSNLNLDGWENETDSKRDSDTVRLGGQGSLQVVTRDNAETPRFGRKRVAWT